eukprot:m.59384 g.59384  ORF g.59384 m.59384 type:complete len:2246 (-) comp22699_c2_seq1:263-7000(-)
MSGCELEVTIIKAENLPIVKSALAGRKLNCNCHAEAEIDGEKLNTKVIRHSKNPTWNHTQNFVLKGPLTASSQPLVIKVVHTGRVGKSIVGRCDVRLGALAGTRTEKKFFKLVGPSGTSGRIMVELKYTDPNPPANAPKSSTLNSDTTQEESQVQSEMALRKKNESMVKIDVPLSSKKGDFQIKIRVIQARGLQANNSIDPIAKITILGVRHQTRKKLSTFNPWFDETLYFSFNESPAKLFDQFIEFQVYNSRSIRSDSVIGSFRLDVGLVHQQDSHSFSRKWLMLSDPKDPASGVKGYLKISVCVLGAGEEGPQEEEVVVQDQNEDMEANMLRPFGVQSEPVDLIIKMFKGFDIPRADISMKTGVKFIDKYVTKADKKEECDPYTVVSFSGRRAKTKVVTNTYNPVWMQELTVPALLPSMCDRLTFQIFDSDLGWVGDSDDTLATYSLPLGQVSYSCGDEMGFLPSFGPAYVNFYGAPREFEMLPGDHAEDLNEGIGEGVAYRGRVLMELVSQTGGDAQDGKAVDLPDSEELRLEPYMQTKTYTLKIELVDLNMIMDKLATGPIQVEVSMGNVGNINEGDVAIGTSITSKTKAHSDGSNYRFLAWENKHPILEITEGLVWEDVEFRIEAHNLLSKVTDEFAFYVDALKHHLSLPEPSQQEINDMYFLMKHGLEKYILACGETLPPLPLARYTKLDYDLKTMRQENRKLALVAAKYVLSHPPTPETKSGIAANLGGLTQRGSSGVTDDLLTDLESLLRRFSELVYDPQMSLPDIIIWVITKGKRKAYLRIPAADIFFHEDSMACGKDFGVVKTAFMKSPQAYKGKESVSADVPAQIQYRAWFGTIESTPHWPKLEAPVVLLAEAYENERWKLGGWGNPLPNIDRPKWSDALGEQKRVREDVMIATGLQFDGDWYQSVEEIEVDPEASLDAVCEEVWEYERYLLPPLTVSPHWGKPPLEGTPNFSDLEMSVKYEATKGHTPESLRDVIDLQPGWKWIDRDWKLDVARPVDVHGWEYAQGWKSTFYPQKKRLHFVRKRRWVRNRMRDPDARRLTSIKMSVEEEAEDEEGWEYNGTFSSDKPWHRIKRKMDYVRRRRWHRHAVAEWLEREILNEDGEFEKIVEQSPIPPDITPEEMNNMYCIGRFLSYDEPKPAREFQLRAHIYQARNLIAEDENGLSDPYVRIVFGHRTSKSRIVSKTVCPTWSETILLDSLDLSGGHLDRIQKCCEKLESLNRKLELDLQSIEGQTDLSQIERLDKECLLQEEFRREHKRVDTFMKNAFPRLILEMYDHDPRGKHDFLGRVVVDHTKLHIRTNDFPGPAILEWLSLDRYEEDAGQVLCAFELIPCANAPSFPLSPSKSIKEDATSSFKSVIPIPLDIAPETELTRIDILAWGLRRLSKFKLLRVGTPAIQFECGGVQVETHKIRSFKHNNNFARDPDHCILSFEVWLPVKLIYAPPLNIRVFDNRKFGRKPTVGVSSISNIRDFMIKDGCAHSGGQYLEIEGPNGPEDGDGFRPRRGTMESLRRNTATSRMVVNQLHASSLEKKKKVKNLQKILQRNKGNHADPEFLDDTVDWWTKYFSSPNATDSAGRTKSKPFTGNLVHVFGVELEHAMRKRNSLAPATRVFDPQEIVHTMDLHRGKGLDQKVSGLFKGDIAVFDADRPDDHVMKWDRLPPQEPIDCVVRVYIVKARELVPKDINGRADPYVKIKMGKEWIVNDRKNYIPSNLNPVFGRHFEFEATIPLVHEITVALYDYDTISHDDLLGETKIDLEARLLSSVRAQCGLPLTYVLDGPDVWRDQLKPFELLCEYCGKWGLPAPTRSTFDPSIPVENRQAPHVMVQDRGGKEPRMYTPQFHDPDTNMKRSKLSDKLKKCWDGESHDDEEYENQVECAALVALHRAGYVPEHVETRKIISPIQPGFTLGKLEMWVDIFPKINGDETVVPEPIDITPRIPDEYELRIVMYNVDEVILDESNMAGERMSDIYVKTFFRGMENQRQKTDVHYRSLNGEGNFNWRLKHKFHYLPSEQNIVVKKKASFLSWNAEEMRVPPILVMQIWDNDLFSKDDYLGEVELNLNEFQQPSRMSRDAIMVRPGEEIEQPVNLFRTKRVNGWLAALGFERTDPEYETTPDGLRRKKWIMAGKFEFEMELLTKEEAGAKPAGFGRKDPNMNPFLEKPIRPATSFAWFTSPFKALRYILWKNYWQYLLMLLLLGIAIAYLIIFLYHSPYFMNQKSFSDTDSSSSSADSTNPT